jgi:hypothetical protein
VAHWVDILRVDPGNRLIQRLLARVLAVTPAQLMEASAGTFVYAGLLFTEGLGLLFIEETGNKKQVDHDSEQLGLPGNCRVSWCTREPRSEPVY